ncbi:hypothetical protein DERF_000095 [Dermatophagoides farinae]|uniref:Peptidase S1 domain-containing protein n=1 Tax=Dermatophagoides farinae TaxID=6954 RepID=A0A922IAU0_DERFA|nr:hypothetical protein DERF_000095 [Dermatophagoides farinae]
MITNLFSKLTNKFYLFYPQKTSSLLDINHQQHQQQRNDSFSSSSSMATMIMNGVAIPSLARNGGPTAKFLIKPPMNDETNLHSNHHHNQKNDDVDGELTQNINIEHNPNKNIDNNHHYHLHIPGHNSSPSDLIFGFNAGDKNDRKKKYSIQNNGNAIEQNDNGIGVGIVPLLNRHDSNMTTVPSCTISINNGGHNNQQSDQKSTLSNHHHHHHHNHRFHQFFGSSSSSSSTPTTTTTTTETTLSSNLSLNGHRKKSWKMILCSWILTILAILIIIGISFVCGFLAAQYIYKYHCDVSSISSEKNHLISSNNQPSSQENDGQNQRIGRFNRFGHIWSYTSKTPENNVSSNIENSTLNINTTTVKPIAMVIYSVDSINDDRNDSITEHYNDDKIVPIINQNFTTTTESNIDQDSNRTRNFEQQNPISGQPFTSETPLPFTTAPSSNEEEKMTENNDENTTPRSKTLSPSSSPSTTPPTATEMTTTTSESSNFLSTLIDEYNQVLNDSIKQTSHEAGDVFYPIFNFSSTPTANMTSMEFLESNKTEIISNEQILNSTIFDDDSNILTTTLAPPTSTELVFNSTKDDNNYDDDDESDDNITSTIMMTTSNNNSSSSVELIPNSVDVQNDNSSIDPDSYLVPSWLIPNDTYDQTDSAETTTMTTTTTTNFSTTTTKRTTIDDENSTSTLNNTDSDNDDEFTTELSNFDLITNETDIPDNYTETVEPTNEFITTTLVPETNRTGRIFSHNENNDNVDGEIIDEHDMIHNENNTTMFNVTNGSNQIMAMNNVTNLPIFEPPLCLDAQFQCPNTTSSECLDKSRICDGIVDCPQDLFDELDCMEKNCGQNFRCGRTIPPISEADSNETLPLNNHSIAMDTISVKSKPNIYCIPRSHYCDGIWDCHDGSDEIDCHIDKCETGKVLCRDNSACITGKQACDGVYNCRDRSDEAGCGTKSSCESKGKFYCDDSSLCISKSLVCDGIADCLNGDDEKDCLKPETCRAEDSKFFCQHSSECIDRSKRCDGHVDCIDYSDEDRCFESDLDDYVYAFNGAKNHWSLLCVSTLFDYDDADEICTKMGMSYAVNFSTIKISRLLNDSTWAILSNSSSSSSSSSKIISFESSCSDNLALMIECEQLHCDSRTQLKKTNIAIETPEEIPTPISIHNSTNHVQTCLAYTLSPKLLLTSGQCLMTLEFTKQNLTVNVGGKEMPIERVRVHPKYSNFRTIRFADYDMALIETSELIPEHSLNHSSICLPSSKLDPEITCFIGNYRNSDTAFKVLESSYCNTTEHFAGLLTNRHVCAAEDSGNSAIQSKPGICLPPYLPLICLSSQSHWYIAGYSSYQHGCDPLTGHPIFRGYSPHPTLFSNLFSMHSFIDQTLGRGTYRRKRSKLNEINNNDRPNISEQPSNANEEKRAVFIVSGSVEDQQWLLEQDARKQKSFNINNTNTINEDEHTTLKTDITATTL